MTVPSHGVLRRAGWRRHALMVSLVAICGLILAACGSSSRSSTTQSAAASGGSGQSSSTQTADKSPFLIGQPLALSGFGTVYDVPAQTGAKVAALDFNSQGGILGHPIKFVAADVKTQPSAVTAAAEQLLGDKINAMMTSDVGLPLAGAAARLSSNQQIPAVGVASDPGLGVQGAGSYAYNIGNTGATMGTAMGVWAAKHYRRMYVLIDESYTFTGEECKYAAAAFKANGGTVLGTVTFHNTDPSITTQVAQVKAANPDVIAMCSLPPGGVTALRDIRSGGLNTEVIADESMDGEYWIKAIPTLSNYNYVAYVSIFGNDPDPKVNQLTAAFTRMTGRPPLSGMYMYGYCAVQALRLAAQMAGSIDGPKLKAALDKFTNAPLICGSTTWTPANHSTLGRSVRVMQVKDGKFSYTTSVAVNSLPPTS